MSNSSPTEETTPLPTTNGASFDAALWSGSMVSTICVVMPAILIAFFIGETTYSESEYSVKEYIAFCDIMVMLLLGFGYLMTFLKKYGMGASCFHHDVVFLNMELNIVVEFYVRLLYSEKG